MNNRLVVTVEEDGAAPTSHAMSWRIPYSGLFSRH